MFKALIVAFLTALSRSSAALAGVVQAPHDTASLPVLFNGENITFDYSDVFLSGDSLFGMGLLATGADQPETVVSDGWEGPVILNIDDQDVIPATYVLQYPFFSNGTSYTAQLFEYNTTTLEVTTPNVRNATFIWVNQPGQDV